MADTTTQKFNQTIYWADFVANSYTLFTTDASTRYVIKDIEIADNTFPSSFNLVVNDTKVASLSGNLTGTEIIDVGSTVRMTYDTSTAAYISVNCLSNSSQAFSNNVTSGAVFYTPTGFLTTPAVANTPVAMTQLTTPSNNQGGWLLNGNFYYMNTDQNSQQALYRRAGGVTGTQSTIYNDSYAPGCFDGVSKFYWVNNSGQLYSYDTTTDSSSYLAGWNTGTTYPMLCVVGGYVFYSPSYNGYNYLRWYRISNGGSGTTSTPAGTTPYSSNTGPCCFYNSANGSIRICLGNFNSYSSSYAFYDISVASGTPVITNTGTGSMTKNFRFNSQSSLGNVGIMLGSSNGSYNDIYLVDSSMSVISQKTITGDYFGGPTESGSFQVITPSAPVQAATSPSLRLRITGVQTV